jgi:hypothetical protein
MGTSSAGALVKDLRNRALPAFAFVKPNGCNDMHNLCGGKTVSDMIKRGDAWLKTWIELIAASPGYSKGDTAIFVTFDEGEVTTNPSNLEEDCMQTLSETCHIATVVVTPYLNAASSSTFYSTYSLLKTTEEMLGLSPLLGHAADASTASMRPGLGF